MKKKLSIVAATIILAASAFYYYSPKTEAAGGQSQTGQGIMVNMEAHGNFTINDTQVYKFNEDTAATYFTNSWDGAPASETCTGSGCGAIFPTAVGSVTVSPAYSPYISGGTIVAPPAPAPNDDYVHGNPNMSIGGAISDNMCNFLNGGSLTGSSYTKTVPEAYTVTYTNDKGRVVTAKANVTWTYNYNVTPTVETIPPFEAWDLFSETSDGLVHVPVNAQIAGESALKTAKLGGTKYSFSMLDSYGLSRVSGLTVTVTDASNNVVATYSDVPSDVVFPVDFTYTTNAGSNGTIGLLTNGDARTILNSDAFKGNDNGGADGSALAEAFMQGVSIPVGPGTYNVTLTGTVKDNTATADIGFTVTQAIHIVTPGCNGQ